jgi:hypothetical protein
LPETSLCLALLEAFCSCSDVLLRFLGMATADDTGEKKTRISYLVCSKFDGMDTRRVKQTENHAGAADSPPFVNARKAVSHKMGAPGGTGPRDDHRASRRRRQRSLRSRLAGRGYAAGGTGQRVLPRRADACRRRAEERRRKALAPTRAAARGRWGSGCAPP